MFNLYHGMPLKYKSQLEMLVEGTCTYSKRNEDNNLLYELKKSLVKSFTCKYYAGIDITKVLVTGKRMMESSKKDLKFYRKAMSFLKEKWDLKTRSPKESGSTPEDVLE